MASATYSTQALVLKKTKLSESDLILTLLLSDGSQKQVVAKGARKPTSSFSSRLELFSLVHLLCAEGKSLDIVKEARLQKGHEPMRERIELTYAGSPLLELLVKVSQPGLANEKLYLSTLAALDAMCESSEQMAPGICAAQILKVLAFEGLRPSLRNCVGCGSPVDLNEANAHRHEPLFSMSEGGLVCPVCAASADCLRINAHTLKWADYLLRSPYSDIVTQNFEAGASFDVLRFCQGLVHAQLGLRLKSLDMLFTCGFF